MGSLLNSYLVYSVVFLAIVLPVALWRRENRADSSNHLGRWENMPSLFKRLWDIVEIIEFPFGVPLAKMMPVKSEKYRKWILAAGLPLTPEKIYSCQLLSLLGGIFLGALLFLVPGINPILMSLFVTFFAFAGCMYPAIVLEKYVRWRQNEITRTLPFAIDLIGSAMRAGLEFGAAMRYFEGLKMKGPLTEEFGVVLQQIELGKTRTKALSDMAVRIQVEAFTSFVGVVAYGTEIGASISETLRVHGEELRRARFHLAERKAARAPSLMILPMAVFIMPAVFIVVITPIILKMKATGIGGH